MCGFVDFDVLWLNSGGTRKHDIPSLSHITRQYRQHEDLVTFLQLLCWEGGVRVVIEAFLEHLDRMIHSRHRLAYSLAFNLRSLDRKKFA